MLILPTPDIINSVFQSLASLFLLNHCRVLHRVKQLKGISVVSVVFFFTWGAWNVFFFRDLNQTFSWYASIAMLAANTIWVAMVFYYSHRPLKLRRQARNNSD